MFPKVGLPSGERHVNMSSDTQNKYFVWNRTSKETHGHSQAARNDKATPVRPQTYFYLRNGFIYFLLRRSKLGTGKPQGRIDRSDGNETVFCHADDTSTQTKHVICPGSQQISSYRSPCTAASCDTNIHEGRCCSVCSL